MNINEARNMVREVAESRQRWGKHAGFGPYHEDDVMDALILVYEGGFLDLDTAALTEMKEKVTLAHRQAGAAKARAEKYKGQVDSLNARIKELVVALEDSELQKAGLEQQVRQQDTP
jgi:hypothetical protein